MTTDNPQPAADPLKSVAQALQTAAAAVRDGAGDATARVREGLPEAGKFVSRFVYASCYFASYGVVFPTVFVASFVPGMGPIAAGLSDGAKAASDYVGEMRAKTACTEIAAVSPPPETVAPASKGEAPATS